MKGILNRIISAILFILLTNDILSQSEYLGKMKKSEYPKGKCLLDTTATAYFIFDRGLSTLNPIENGWKLNFERHYRIKIDDRKSIKEGNITLWLHDKGSEGKESIVDIKGFTYNLENKKWVVTKANFTNENTNTIQKLLFPGSLNLSSTVRANDSDDPEWKRVDIKLPNVKKGSVIELYYKIESDLFFEMEGWRFQKHLPSMHSQYSTIIPEYFEYKPIIYNQAQLKINSEIAWRDLYSFSDVVTKYEAFSLLSNANIPHIRNVDDFLPQVKYEFLGYKYNNKVQSFTKTWKETKSVLLSDTAFGAQLKQCNCFNEIAEDIKSKEIPVSDKILLAYDFVKDKISWNRGTGIKAEIPIDSAYKYKSGTAAEINLSLICFLQKMNIPAKPLITSTADHGMVIQSIPNLKWFDYTLAVVHTDDKDWILDAADPSANINLLPPNVLNGLGLLIDTTNEEEKAWLEIKANGILQSHTHYDLTLDPSKGIKGNYTSREIQYAYYNKKKSMGDSSQYNQYFDELNYTHPKISLYNTKVTDQADRNEIVVEGDILLTRQLESQGDKLLWVPMQYERILENPFISNTRTVPIDFVYPVVQNVTIKINIPNGYEVDQLPKSARYGSTDNSMRYTYILDQNDSTIVLNSMLSLKRSLFMPEEYKGIQEFFTHIVNKQKEVIVFRKK